MPKDAKSAARWLALAADKGQYEAQATLGQILFRGARKCRGGEPLGLMWLTLASDGSGDQVPWIADAREAAFKQATEDERALALTLIERRLNRRQSVRGSDQLWLARLDRQIDKNRHVIGRPLPGPYMLVDARAV